ncbi:MAG: hypothetical protein EA411_03895, partial [Saprospirales bacterium]
ATPAEYFTRCLDLEFFAQSHDERVLVWTHKSFGGNLANELLWEKFLISAGNILYVFGAS